MNLPLSKLNPELDALLERAKNHVMTKAERDAQQESWVVGEMMLEHPEMTRGEARRGFIERSLHHSNAASISRVD